MALVNVPAGSHVQHSCLCSRGQRPSRGGQRPAMGSEVSELEEPGSSPSATAVWEPFSLYLNGHGRGHVFRSLF